MKLYNCSLQVLKIASLMVFIFGFYSILYAQENDSFPKLKEDLLVYPLEKPFDSQSLLAKYKESIHTKTVDELIEWADSELADNPERSSFVLKFARNIAYTIGNKRLEGVCFSKLGDISFATNEYDLAAKYYANGRELLITAQVPEIITLLLNYSDLYIAREEYDEAKIIAEEGLKFIERYRTSEYIISNPNLESTFQATLGEITYKKGEYLNSASLLKSAIENFEKRKLNRIELLSYEDTLLQLGKTYRALGEYNFALINFNKALEKGKDSPDEAFYPNVLNSIALLYMEERDYEKAREYLTKSLQLFEERKIEFEKADVLLHLGIICVRQGHSQEGIKYLDVSFELYERNHSKEGIIAAGDVLGTVYRLAGNYTEAANWFNKSLELAEKQHNNLRLAEIYWQISELNLDKKDWPEAVKTGLKALSFNHTQSNPNLFYLVNTALGRAYLKQGDFQNSEKYLRAAIQSIDDSRSRVSGSEENLQLFFVDKLEAYRNLIDAFVLQNRLEEALLYSERAKARVLYDSFQGRKDINESKETNVINTSIPTLNQDDIKNLVKDGQTTFLTYVIGNENIYLFVSTNDKQRPVQVFPLKVKIEDLERRVDEFSCAIATHDLLFVDKAKALYELLIAPAKGLVNANRRVVIVPDGFLWNLPFQALMDGENKYLLEKYEISYTPSLSVAIELRKKAENKINRSTAKNELLAVGNPLRPKSASGMSDNRSEEYSELPEAETEVLSLGGIYGRDRSKVFVKEKASESQIVSLIQNYRILHFATHGILYKEHPLQSSLVLSKSNSEDKSNENDDGFLKGDEIIRLRLTAGLVVLSACESAQGEITNGEGMVGLSWAFLYAGASNVVASQWKVDSASTSKLMQDFHRELAKQRGNEQSIATALRTAALKLKESEAYKHPFYWASFIQIGSGN